MSNNQKRRPHEGKDSQTPTFNVGNGRHSAVLWNIMSETAKKEAIATARNTTVNGGASCLHLAVNLEAITNASSELIKGDLQAMVGSIIAQQGYSPSQDEVTTYMNAVSQVLATSAHAHACLLKIFQIQNGAKLVDIKGMEIAGVFFSAMPTTGDMSDAYSKAGTVSGTPYESSISNAVWKKDYVGKLQYTYTSATMRSLLASLFVPVIEMSHGTSPRTTYANMWPVELLDNPDQLTLTASDMKTQFDNEIDEIQRITTAYPLVTTILSYLGFQIGTDFDYTRMLDQTAITIQPDSGLVEMLIATASTTAFTDSLFEPFLDRFVFTSNNSPFESSVSMEMNNVSLYSLLNGNVVVNSYSSISESESVFVAYYLANINFVATPGTAENIPAAVSNIITTLNNRASSQRGRLDIDITYTQKVIISNTTFSPITKEFEICPGYGTYIIPQASVELAHQLAATAIMYGAEYEKQFEAKLNALPPNVIKIA